MESVRPVAAELASRDDLVVWAVSFVREAGREVLRVAVDRAGGIDADELARFSESLSRELDRTQAVPGDARYTLEITSPGAERKLDRPEHFGVCVGRVAKVKLVDGRTIEGPIVAAAAGAVEIDAGDEHVRASYDDIVSARLVVKL